MFEIYGEFLMGVSLGFEFAPGEVLDDGDQWAVMIDLLIFRLIFIRLA